MMMEDWRMGKLHDGAGGVGGQSSHCAVAWLAGVRRRVAVDNVRRGERIEIDPLAVFKAAFGLLNLFGAVRAQHCDRAINRYCTYCINGDHCAGMPHRLVRVGSCVIAHFIQRADE